MIEIEQDIKPIEPLVIGNDKEDNKTVGFLKRFLGSYINPFDGTWKINFKFGKGKD